MEEPTDDIAGRPPPEGPLLNLFATDSFGFLGEYPDLVSRPEIVESIEAASGLAAESRLRRVEASILTIKISSRSSHCFEKTLPTALCHPLD